MSYHIHFPRYRIFCSSDAETLQGLDKDDGKEIERAKENLFCINDGCDFIGELDSVILHFG